MVSDEWDTAADSIYIVGSVQSDYLEWMYIGSPNEMNWNGFIVKVSAISMGI